MSIESIVTRQYTNKLIELINDGLLDPNTIVSMCVNYMSEQEVKDMVHTNDLEELFGIEKEE